MKYAKKAFYIFTLLALMMNGMSCTNGGVKIQNKVGVLMRNDTDAFLQGYIQSIYDYSKKENIPIELYACNDDVAVQIDQLKTLLLNGVRYFVIVAVNTDITEQMTRLIQSQGGAAAFSNIAPSIQALKVGQNFYYASSPENVAGFYQAQILDNYFKAHPEKISDKTLNILYFNGEYGHPAQVYRKSGFLAGIKSMGYDVNILAEVGANWIESTSKQTMDNWIDSYRGQFDAIVAQNDAMALGAIQSLLEHSYTDDSSSPASDTDNDGTVLRVPVLGVDATEDGKNSMSRNQLFATVLQDSKTQAETALELVWECKKHGTAIGYTTSSGISGAKEVTDEAPVSDGAVLKQCYVVPFVPVTK